MTPDRVSERWAVVGGGILGMRLASRLAGCGRQVTLFEAAPTMGGLASAWSLGDVVWDRHYHVTLLSDRHTRSLLTELELEEQLQWRVTRTGFYIDGRLISMSNALEFLTFPALALIDKLRLALTIMYASRVTDWRRLESIPVADWLRRLSGQRTFERIWLPLLRSKLGESYRVTSAAFIWATIARMYAARRSGAKREMFGYVPGGYARILARFAERLQVDGVHMLLGRAVRRVNPVGDGTLVIEDVRGGSAGFDRVVVTAPAPLVPAICPRLSDSEKARLQAVRYKGIVCASVLMKAPLSGFYITNITDAGLPFTAVIEMSALVDRHELGGHALVYLPKYVDPDDPLFERDDREIEDSFLAGLGRMHGGFSRSDVLAFRVSRARYVYPLPTLQYSATLPPIRTSVDGLFTVNSSHIVNGTLNVNETVALADRALDQLLDSAAAPPSEASASLACA